MIKKGLLRMDNAYPPKSVTYALSENYGEISDAKYQQNIG